MDGSVYAREGSESENTFGGVEVEGAMEVFTKLFYRRSQLARDRGVCITFPNQPPYFNGELGYKMPQIKTSCFGHINLSTCGDTYNSQLCFIKTECLPSCRR